MGSIEARERREPPALNGAAAEIHIRTFTDESEFRKWRETLARLYKAAYEDLRDYAYTERRRILKYLDWLYHGDPAHFYVAWNQKGEPVGFVSAHSRWQDESLGQVGNIHEMVVAPKYRGRGIGRLLFETAVQAMARENPVVMLWVGEGNLKARSMYPRHGFQEVGRQGKWIKMMRQSSGA